MQALAKLTLYVDIDSTIWPAEDEYDRAAMELYGVEFGTDWYSEAELIERFGPDYQKIFSYALRPERVTERKLYPHAYATLRNLGKTFRLHFISHNYEPDDIESRVREWLERRLGGQFDLTVYPPYNDKVATMNADPFAYGIIEDKATTLVDAMKAGYVTIAKRQPWNLSIVDKYGIMSFDDWVEVPTLVEYRELIGA